MRVCGETWPKWSNAIAFALQKSQHSISPRNPVIPTGPSFPLPVIPEKAGIHLPNLTVP